MNLLSHSIFFVSAFEAPVAEVMKIWLVGVTPCGLLFEYRICGLLSTENGEAKHLWNVGNHMSVHMG